VKKYSAWIFVAAVVLLPMGVFAFVKWYEYEYTKLPVLGGKEHRIAPFQLTDQRGATVSLENWKNRIVIADFFFTHCPVVCPKMTRSLKEVQRLYAGDEALLINSFSVDPERDSVKQLRWYAEKMDIQNNWQLITGDKKKIYQLARNSFKVVATDGDGGPQDFIHSELLVLVDKQQRIRGYYNGTDREDVKKLLRDIRRLKNEYR
jgi:protein SCO1